MRRFLQLVALALGVFSAAGVQAQVKWDLASAYPPQNFHTENIVQFANEVDQATGGKLKITVHPNATLYKANEIKRAVQTGQVQTGEIIISGFANEDPLFGLDGVPFLASCRRLNSRKRRAHAVSSARTSTSGSWWGICSSSNTILRCLFRSSVSAARSGT
jgi:TRAP-type C4-dicarboxylate transport system substrate-binding protein